MKTQEPLRRGRCETRPGHVRTVVRLMDRLNDGGPARQAIALSVGLQNRGWRTVLAVGTVEPHETGMEASALEQGVRLVRIPGLGRRLHLIRDARAFCHIVKLMLAERPDVVHTHKSKAGVLGRLAARLLGVPVICHTFHGHVLDGYFTERTNRLFRLIEALLARLTDRIIVLAPSQKRQLLTWSIGLETQYDVVPSGVPLDHLKDCERHRGELKKELGLDEGLRVIGIVGRLVPIKNHTDFITAAGILSQWRRDVRFVIVGDGDLRDVLERETRRCGLAGTIRFLGHRTDMARIYADLDAVALCSLNEGLPMTLIEAMACGKPVVATDVGGVRDLLEHGRAGILVPARDPGALAEGLRSALEDAGLAERLSRQARTASRRYHVDALVETTRALYESQIAKPSLPTRRLGGRRFLNRDKISKEPENLGGQPCGT